MAEGILKAMDNKLEVHSAGTKPASNVHPFAIDVMNEIGIDISANKPKLVDEFIGMDFDYVITVCDNAKETCPVFIGKVKHQLHIGFPDPADATGSKEEIIKEFRKVRDMINKEFREFYNTINDY
jgi:arsenate reductase (thioredoxin)